MKPRELRLARPIYEGLPWFYVLCGLLALAASYARGTGALSAIVGALGFFCVVGGIVVLLRRRDFRQMRAQYGDPAGLAASPPGGGADTHREGP